MTRELRPSAGYCPYCKAPVVVKGRITRYHWCKVCGVAVDPVSKRGTGILPDPQSALPRENGDTNSLSPQVAGFTETNTPERGARS
jgi:hypothetical protein